MLEGTELAKNLFSEIIGLEARNAQLGYGSFITIDFGENIIIKGKKASNDFERGKWHLWVYMCTWRLEQNGEPIVGAGDEREVLRLKISLLTGKKLLQVKILNKSFDIIFDFENGYRLLLFSFVVEDDEQWMFFTPNRKVFTAGPGTNWEYEDSSKP